MEEQRKERTIDELAAENDALRKKADELNKEIEYLHPKAKRRFFMIPKMQNS